MRHSTSLLLTLLLALSQPSLAEAQLEFENEPINYQTAPVHDRVSKLIAAIDAGTTKLAWDEDHGWLPSVLKELQVPRSSQLLVFSKTSLQLNRISPQRPRALYFNDDTYVGWVQRGDVVELAAVDPSLGTVFYTLVQKPDKPEFRRDKGNCLICHASRRTQDVPGLLVRSVFPARNGQPHFGLGTITTDHRSPLKDRFGGWYVTGQHGSMRHRGNAIADDRREEPIDPEPGANLDSLDGLIRTRPYLERGSDLVALMLLEYQSQAHNALTRLTFETRSALHYDQVMNRALQRPAGFRSDVTQRRIDSAAEKLLLSLFYSGEFRLTDLVRGTSDFTREFQAAGPRDSQGRSLRDFDLKQRMFRYPLSYLIYSESFASLPDTARDRIEVRMAEVLSGEDVSPEFAHLTTEDRAAIREILAETMPAFSKCLFPLAR